MPVLDLFKNDKTGQNFDKVELETKVEENANASNVQVAPSGKEDDYFYGVPIDEVVYKDLSMVQQVNFDIVHRKYKAKLVEREQNLKIQEAMAARKEKLAEAKIKTDEALVKAIKMTAVLADRKVKRTKDLAKTDEEIVENAAKIKQLQNDQIEIDEVMKQGAN